MSARGARVTRITTFTVAALALAACVGKGPAETGLGGAQAGVWDAPLGNDWTHPVNRFQDNQQVLPVVTDRFAANEQVIPVTQQQNCFNPPTENGRLGDWTCEPLVLPVR